MARHQTAGRHRAEDGPARKADTAPAEKPGRSPLLPGAVVALVALIGADCAVTATAALDRVQKTTLVAARTLAAARTVAPSGPSVRTRVSSLSGGAALLVLLLLAGRRVLVVAPRPAAAGFAPPSDRTWPALLLRAKTSISYHTGGLYGP